MMTVKKMGRPPIENPRNKTIQMRMTQDELDKIQRCADLLDDTRTNTVLKGIDLLMESILKKEK